MQNEEIVFTTLIVCYQQVMNKISDKPRSSFNSTQLWHERMAHLNFPDLINAVKKRSVRSMNLKHGHDHIVCETCIEEKMTRFALSKGVQSCVEEDGTHTH